MKMGSTNAERSDSHGGNGILVRLLRRMLMIAAWLGVLLLSAWCGMVVWFGLPFPHLRIPAVIIYVLSLLAVILYAREKGTRLAICLGGFAVVLLWWLSLKPSNDRNWQGDVAQTAWAEVQGDVGNIHNYRDCR